MSVLAAVLFGVAWAQEAPVDPLQDADEIVVYADYVVEQARREVVQDLKQEGYTVTIERDDVTIYRHPDPWKGDVHMHDDGWMVIRRQPLQFRPPNAGSAKQASAGSWLYCIWVPACVKVGGVVVSKRKFDAQRGRTYGSAMPEVRDWGDRIADRATKERTDELPDHLEDLWNHGQPLPGRGGKTLTTVAERKEALLDFWNSRADNTWGDRVRVTVEGFMRGVVQYSDDPFTKAEIAAFNAQRNCARVLDLDAPWQDVIASVEPEPF